MCGFFMKKQDSIELEDKNLNDINYIIKLVNESGKYIKITGAFSHFCKAENKKLTDKQFYTFL